MKQQNRFNQSFIPGEVYLFHRTDPACPADGNLYGIFNKETSDAIYLESSSSDLQTFRYWHRLVEDYRYCRLAARSNRGIISSIWPAMNVYSRLQWEPIWLASIQAATGFRSDDLRTLRDAIVAPCRGKCKIVLSSIYSNSGCSLRSTRATPRSCGPSPPPSCGPPTSSRSNIPHKSSVDATHRCLTASNLLWGMPATKRTGCGNLDMAAINNEELNGSGRGLRNARTSGMRVAGLRRAKLRPATVPFGTANSRFKISCNTDLEAAPQPSGRACDVEEQPSARGRLRAAGPDGPILQTIIPPK